MRNVEVEYQKTGREIVMAYCRFSDGDVYLFGSCDGGYECCACRLQPLVPTIFTTGQLPFGEGTPCEICKGNFNGCTACGMHGSLHLKTAAECVEHLRLHRQAGHDVPDDAIQDLGEEALAEKEAKTDER